MSEFRGPHEGGEVVALPDFSAFLTRAEPFLLERETLNNLLWEVGAALERKGSPEAWFGVVERADEIILAGVRSTSEYLILSAGDPEAADVLARRLAASGMKLGGVTGWAGTAEVFAQAWARETDEPLGRSRSMTTYELAAEDALSCGSPPPGEARRAEDADAGLVREWAIGFAAESVSPMDPSALADWAEAIRRRGDLYLWVDGEPVAMACFGRRTPNGLVINLVYAPGERRRRGYAGALLAELATEAKRRGAGQCCLFSEYGGERNLYARLGFRPAGEFCERSFSA